MATPIKFSLPIGAQYFTLFARLPVELRLQIWEDAIYQPGMNFLKVAYDPSPLGHHGSAWPPTCKATLVPIYPHAKAEDSHFPHLNTVLDSLSMACAESRRVVRRFREHRNTIGLRDGRIVTALDCHDTICLDYIPQNLFTSGCRILTDVKCHGLDRIRHVAIRYCHNWETRNPYCGHCGRTHCADTTQALPLHTYQFLVRHMPNLQTVYFIDFLILRKNTEETISKRPSPTFTSRDRRFFEVESAQDSDWMVSSQVFEVMDWVKENFRRYSVQSTTTRHRHQAPQRVQFKVLSCEWEIGPMIVQPRTQLPTWKKGGNKRVHPGEAAVGRARKASKLKKRQAVTPAEVDFDTNSGFVFGKGGDFNFTFSTRMSMYRGTRRDDRPEGRTASMVAV